MWTQLQVTQALRKIVPRRRACSSRTLRYVPYVLAVQLDFFRYHSISKVDTAVLQREGRAVVVGHLQLRLKL